jgi:hypothetical protein
LAAIRKVEPDVSLWSINHSTPPRRPSFPDRARACGCAARNNCCCCAIEKLDCGRCGEIDDRKASGSQHLPEGNSARQPDSMRICRTTHQHPRPCPADVNLMPVPSPHISRPDHNRARRPIHRHSPIAGYSVRWQRDLRRHGARVHLRFNQFNPD